MTIDHEALRKLAEKAPRQIIPHSPQPDGTILLCLDDEDDTDAGRLWEGQHGLARWIAAVSPAVVVRLLDELAELRAMYQEAAAEVVRERDDARARVAELEADLAARSIEHATVCGLLAAARADRDAARAQVAELTRLGVSIHKAAAAARMAERADVVAHLRTGGPSANDYADDIERGVHEGAAGVKRG